MSDDELLERIRLGMGYLMAHGRLQQCDDLRELLARYAEARRRVASDRSKTPEGQGEGA